MKKIIISFIICLIVAIGLLPKTAMAEDPDTGYYFNIGGSAWSSNSTANFSNIYLKSGSTANSLIDGSASDYNLKIEYDNGFIVTFKDLQYNASNFVAFGATVDFKLVLEGVNTITVNHSELKHSAIMCGCLTAICDHGDSCNKANLTISGDGILNVYAKDGTSDALGYGIYATGNMTINSGTINVNGNNYGIYVGGNLIINGGTVTAKGANSSSASGNTATGDAYGIKAGTYTANGGTVTANGSKQAIALNAAPVMGAKMVAEAAYREIAGSVNYSSFSYYSISSYQWFVSRPATPGTFESLDVNGICFRYNGNNVLTIDIPTTTDYYTYGTASGTTAAQTAVNVAVLPDNGWNWAVKKHAADANGVEYTFIMNNFEISYIKSGMGDGLNDAFLYNGKLNLELRGTNTMTEQDRGGISTNISGENSLYISGDGSLSISGGSYGFHVDGFREGIYVTNGTVEIASDSTVFFGEINITGGTFITHSESGSLGCRNFVFGCGVTAQASVNSDGSNHVAYNSADAGTYKWIKTAYNTPTASKQDGQPATCTLDGWKDYYQCSGCMKYYVDEACTEEIRNLETWKQGEGRIPATDHSYSTTWIYDGVDHWYAATCGHDVVSGKAAHNGGTADCKDKAVCADCGQPYGELAAHSESRQDGQVASCTLDGWKDYYQCSECMKYYVDEACTEEIRNLETWKQGEGRIPATDHSYSTTWIYDGVDHWYAATCGHDVVSGKSAHNGGTADCKDKAVCADCGQPYGELAAHSGSKQDGQPATCTLDGWKDYYQCSGCDKFFSDTAFTNVIEDLAAWKNSDEKIAALGHSGSAEWKNDATNHWKECTVEACGVKLDSATHEFEWKIDKAATETEKGSKHEECKVCGYKKDAVDIPATGMDVEEEEPETDETPQAVETSVETQPPKTGDNGMAGPWIALMFISGFSVVATTVNSRKRNSIR